MLRTPLEKKPPDHHTDCRFCALSLLSSDIPLSSRQEAVQNVLQSLVSGPVCSRIRPTDESMKKYAASSASSLDSVRPGTRQEKSQTKHVMQQTLSEIGPGARLERDTRVLVKPGRLQLHGTGGHFPLRSNPIRVHFCRALPSP